MVVEIEVSVSVDKSKIPPHRAKMIAARLVLIGVEHEGLDCNGVKKFKLL